jgi:hypothetical protein
MGVAASMMFVRGPLSFYLLRFLLGVAAGFFPESSSISANGFCCRGSCRRTIRDRHSCQG